MLNISQDIVSKLDVSILKKQKKLLIFIACLMFIGGILFIIFPFFSGDILSVILGVVLICSSIAFIAVMFKNRVHNFWPVVSGILVSIAYMVMGYFFITAPELGMFAIATLLACLFSLGGIIRIMAWFRQRQVKGSWLQVVIGVLDLFIAWCFISAAPQASIVMVSMVVGIELIISAFSCFGLARLFSQSRG
ncbi:HdeD family acid-resistance protein [[Enterobacter] lignolyticus]|uniref:Acid-resistance membrane protein n=1 Tax=Enterobacter lignolyticus (strain SCF1) TaxID=701347 RepID=E3G1K4_ENTLS|nr:HdeD family acid-resistance protein [[Enterobacter] lignolyticus]ADO50289.1 acid-resistance membrane protein [[Enterobacter] lignolyticus SCF1]